MVSEGSCVFLPHVRTGHHISTEFVHHGFNFALNLADVTCCTFQTDGGDMSHADRRLQFDIADRLNTGHETYALLRDLTMLQNTDVYVHVIGKAGAHRTHFSVKNLSYVKSGVCACHCLSLSGQLTTVRRLFARQAITASVLCSSGQIVHLNI